MTTMASARSSDFKAENFILQRAIDVLRGQAEHAAYGEERAKRTIEGIMRAVVGGAVTLVASGEPTVGLTYASWTNPEGTKGLVVRQLNVGVHTAMEIGRGVIIADGDGLSGLADAVATHFLDRKPS